MTTEDDQFVLPHILATAKQMIDTALPEKSKGKYIAAYENFLDWQKQQGTTSFSEPVLLAYFANLSKKLKPSTLWSIHSMLKTTIDNNQGIDITKYTQLHRFLKKQNIGFQSKKSKILMFEEVEKFLHEAPDDEYLATKAALIIGVYGACRGGELCQLMINNVIDKNSVLHITLPDTKTHLPRTFVIDGEFYNIVKKYINLRPQGTAINRFFLNYRSGKCTNQPIGKNKLSNMPSVIATYLNLPNVKAYTGYTFRRTSATILADAGADLLAIKRLGGWKSDRVAEGYIEDSVQKKRKRSDQITEVINSNPSSTVTSESENKTNNMEETNFHGLLSKTLRSSAAEKENAGIPATAPPTQIHYHFNIASIGSFTFDGKKD